MMPITHFLGLLAMVITAAGVTVALVFYTRAVNGEKRDV